MNAEKGGGDLVGEDEENIRFLSFATFGMRRARRSLASRRIKNVHEFRRNNFGMGVRLAFAGRNCILIM